MICQICNGQGHVKGQGGLEICPGCGGWGYKGKNKAAVKGKRCSRGKFNYQKLFRAKRVEKDAHIIN